MWSHLLNLPGWNGFLLVSTCITFVVLAWAALAAGRTAWTRHPPLWNRSHNEVVRGRRAWATAAVLATMAIWCVYRIDILWWLDNPVSYRAIFVEILRAAAALWLAYAWLVPLTSET